MGLSGFPSSKFMKLISSSCTLYNICTIMLYIVGARTTVYICECDCWKVYLWMFNVYLFLELSLNRGYKLLDFVSLHCKNFCVKSFVHSSIDLKKICSCCSFSSNRIYNPDTLRFQIKQTNDFHASFGILFPSTQLVTPREFGPAGPQDTLSLTCWFFHQGFIFGCQISLKKLKGNR